MPSHVFGHGRLTEHNTKGGYRRTAVTSIDPTCTTFSVVTCNQLQHFGFAIAEVKACVVAPGTHSRELSEDGGRNTVVKRLTEMHGGTVTIDSHGSGRGTDVTISLAPSAGRLSDSGTVTRIPQPELKGLRLLVVEDMDDARETTSGMLERFGAEVHVGDPTLRPAATL